MLGMTSKAHKLGLNVAKFRKVKKFDEVEGRTEQQVDIMSSASRSQVASFHLCFDPTPPCLPVEYNLLESMHAFCNN